MIDTEALKRKILDLAIKGKLVPQDPTDEPASELLKRIKNERDRLIDEGKIKGKKDDFSYIFKGDDNCYYEKKSSNQIQNITLPTKWCLISLKFLCSLEKGNFNSGENLKYLDVKTLRNEKEPKIIKSGYIVNPNEKVIIVDGENSGEIFTVSERGYMGSTMRLFVANKYIDQEYLDIFLQTLKNTLRKNKKGSAIPHLNPGLFYSFMVPLPPIEEQKRIANKVNVILKKLEEIKLINENIAKLKDIIRTRIIHLGVNGKLLKSDDNYYYQKELKTIELSKALIYEQPTKYIVQSEDYNDEYKTPVLTAGKSFILGKSNETNGIFKASIEPVLIFDDFTTSHHYVDFDFKVKSSAMKILKSSDKENYDIKFLNYLLSSISINANTHKRYWISIFAKLNVEIPSIKFQQKIVKIIETLINKLNLSD